METINQLNNKIDKICEAIHTQKNILKWTLEENKQATKNKITQLENQCKTELDKLIKII